jgi:hypothetical protein
LEAGCYYQQNVTRAKQQGPEQEAGHSQAKGDEGEGEEREEEERGGSGVGKGKEGSSAAACRAEMKAGREKKPDTQDMLGEHRSYLGHAQRPLQKRQAKLHVPTDYKVEPYRP